MQIVGSDAVPADERDQYEIDHRIPLAIGGDNAPTNLWPLWKPEARRKARFELQLYLQLRDGEISQVDAISMILVWR